MKWKLERKIDILENAEGGECKIDFLSAGVE